MIWLNQRARMLALVLAMLAGYVDAIGFIQIGGFFVSFMSGNSTRLAVGLMHDATDWMKAAGLIAGFFLGVIAGSLTGRLAPRRHRAVPGGCSTSEEAAGPTPPVGTGVAAPGGRVGTGRWSAFRSAPSGPRAPG